MLSSVSYVCLGACAGMWVISRGSAWLEASRTQGLCVFLLGQTEI